MTRLNDGGSQMKKSTVEQIRARFDRDVQRFSNLDTGQSSTVDAPLAMALVAEAAIALTPHATQVLDVGCGAGNYSLRLLQEKPSLDFTLIDLSQPMLNRAVERLHAASDRDPSIYQADIRRIEFPESKFDIIVAASVLHHLRNTSEWEDVFSSFYRWLRPGGSVWIFDLVIEAHPKLHQIIWKKYGEYLSQLKDEAYRETVFRYIDEEDTPRTLEFQLQTLQKVGFNETFLLHKSLCFAAFGAAKHSA